MEVIFKEFFSPFYQTKNGQADVDVGEIVTVLMEVSERLMPNRLIGKQKIDILITGVFNAMN